MTSPRRRRFVIAGSIAAVVLVASVATGAIVSSVIAADSLNAASTRASALLERAEGEFRAADSLLEKSHDTLDESDGRVLDDAPRAAFADLVDTADEARVAARAELDALDAAVRAAGSTSALDFGATDRARAEELARAGIPETDRFTAASALLEGPRADITLAVAAWTEEQERIVRDRYVNTVWASGWYPELDACKGSVDLTARYDGVPTIAEHWSCGGREFPQEPGTLITLTGEHSGTYRVEGIQVILNQATATTDDIPRGFDLVYQTCQNGQSSSMSMTGLTRVGDAVTVESLAGL
ncbi:hypothetical protein MN032_00160 [Agromyces atrinae]|uniref:hypothetical protein n=1 Tax=Agromyces atrinae TaxID=592376 RepID=UPI001F55F6E9|nr:hypothetical protein [Agromyces atrinae]MCI2956092.1 hypothetical protein [Agromyces atrinae]